MEYRSVVRCDALLLLERVENAAASLVYFDPPTGAFADEGERDQLRSLYLYAACHAKRILCDIGLLTWHTVPEAASDVRRCLDRVFGSRFFVTEIVLHRRLSARPRAAPITDYTSLLVYSKTGEFHYAPPTRPLSENKRKLYSRSDSGGQYRLVDLTMPVNRPNLQFSWRNYLPPAGRSWRCPLSRLEELHADGGILISDSGIPREKVYLSDTASEEIGSVWNDIDLPATERLRGASAGQQSLALMTRVISMWTHTGDLVIDPFCGSGATLLAAEQLDRTWLGSDSSSACCEQIIARLGRLEGRDFAVLPEEELRKFPVQCGLIELVRELPTPAGSDIHDLITSPESKTLEFKQTLSVDVRTGKKESYIELASLKTIAGFLNSDGGILLVGVTDKGEPLGLDNEIRCFHKGSTDPFLLHFKNLIRANIGEAFYPLLDYGLVSVDSRQILRVNCKPSDYPCFIGDDFYVRTNPATDKLTGPKVLEYVSRRFPKYGSERLAGGTPDA